MVTRSGCRERRGRGIIEVMRMSAVVEEVMGGGVVVGVVEVGEAKKRVKQKGTNGGKDKRNKARYVVLADEGSRGWKSGWGKQSWVKQKSIKGNNKEQKDRDKRNTARSVVSADEGSQGQDVTVVTAVPRCSHCLDAHRGRPSSPERETSDESPG